MEEEELERLVHKAHRHFLLASYFRRDLPRITDADSLFTSECVERWKKEIERHEQIFHSILENLDSATRQQLLEKIQSTLGIKTYPSPFF